MAPFVENGICIYRCSQCGYWQKEKADSCPQCRRDAMLPIVFQIPAQEKPKTDEEWIRGIRDNDKLWYKPAFADFPSIIAHEYWRLYELCEQNQPYGVLFQIRDLIEVTFKYQILVICAWACEAEVPSFGETIAPKLTMEKMTLGKWFSFGTELRKFFKRDEISRGDKRYHVPSPLWRNLEKLVKSYNSDHILNWRNERIGHGALGFSQEKVFREDIERLLEYFSNLFEGLKDGFGAQEMFIGDLLLKGKDFARNLPLSAQHAPLSVRVANSDVSFSVEPYMKEIERGIYFFDNQKAKTLSQMLSYPSGQRKERHEEYFSRLFEKRPLARTGVSVDSVNMSTEEELIIDRMAVKSDFVEPKHVTQWLKSAVSGSKKGVFLLKMCRGTGKSTYAEKLSRLGEKPLVLAKNLDVRTYHIVRTQMITACDFERHIEYLWTLRDAAGIDWTRAKRISDYRREGLTPSQALARFLNQCRAFTEERRGRQRVMLVVDGLDEIANREIWEYFRDGEQLCEGVYILLTSRDPEQEDNLPQEVVSNLSRLRVTRSLSVGLGSQENRAFLKACFADDPFKNLSDEEKEKLMQLAGYRVLYLDMLCKLWQAGYSVEKVASSSMIAAGFLDLLEQNYGNKESARLRELLSVLCTLGQFEPLSLRELACLTGDGCVVIDLLIRMNHISPLLKLERGYTAGRSRHAGKNRYSPANDELADSVKRRIAEAADVQSQIVLNALIFSREVGDGVESGDGLTCCDDGEIAATLLVLAHVDRLAQSVLFDGDGGILLNGERLDLNGARKAMRFIEAAKGLPDEEYLTQERKEAALLSLHRLFEAARQDEKWLELDKWALMKLLEWDSVHSSLCVDMAKWMDEHGQPDQALDFLLDCVDCLEAYCQEETLIFWAASEIGRAYAQICVNRARWETCLALQTRLPTIDLDRFVHKSHVELGDGIEEELLLELARAFQKETRMGDLHACYPFINMFRQRADALLLGGRDEEARMLQNALADLLLDGWQEIQVGPDTDDVGVYWIGYAVQSEASFGEYEGPYARMTGSFDRVCKKMRVAGKSWIVREIVDIFKEQVDRCLENGSSLHLIPVADLYEENNCKAYALELLRDRMLRMDDYDRVDVLRRIAAIHTAEGRRDLALAAADRAFAVIGEGDRRELARMYRARADILRELERREEADESLEAAAETYLFAAEQILLKLKNKQLNEKRIGTTFALSDMLCCFAEAAECFALRGRGQKARAVLDRMTRCMEEIGRDKRACHFAALEQIEVRYQKLVEALKERDEGTRR